MGYIISDIHVTFTDLGRRYLIGKIPNRKTFIKKVVTQVPVNQLLVPVQPIVVTSLSPNTITLNGLNINGLTYNSPLYSLGVLDSATQTFIMNSNFTNGSLPALKANQVYRLKLTLVDKNQSYSTLKYRVRDLSSNNIYFDKYLVFANGGFQSGGLTDGGGDGLLFGNTLLNEGFTGGDFLPEAFSTNFVILDNLFTVRENTEELIFEIVGSYPFNDNKTYFLFEYELTLVSEQVETNVPFTKSGILVDCFTLGDSDINYNNTETPENTVSISGEEQNCINGTKHNDIRYNINK